MFCKIYDVTQDASGCRDSQHCSETIHSKAAAPWRDCLNIPPENDQSNGRQQGKKLQQMTKTALYFRNQLNWNYQQSKGKDIRNNFYLYILTSEQGAVLDVKHSPFLQPSLLLTAGDKDLSALDSVEHELLPPRIQLAEHIVQ